MNQNVRFALVLGCKKNANPASLFFLHSFESPQTFDNQLMWPKENWPLAVLCNQCFEPSEYSEQDIGMEVFDSTVQGPLPPMRIWSIEVQCDRESCGFLTKIHFQAGIGSVKENILLKFVEKQARIPCQKCRQSISLSFQSCKNVNCVAEVCT